MPAVWARDHLGSGGRRRVCPVLAWILCCECRPDDVRHVRGRDNQRRVGPVGMCALLEGEVYGNARRERMLGLPRGHLWGCQRSDDVRGLPDGGEFGAWGLDLCRVRPRNISSRRAGEVHAVHARDFLGEHRGAGMHPMPGWQLQSCHQPDPMRKVRPGLDIPAVRLGLLQLFCRDVLLDVGGGRMRALPRWNVFDHARADEGRRV